MTDNNNNNLITPPRELVREWAKTCSPYEVPADHIATQAARWGADQELEACVEWLETYVQRWAEWSASFRADRRSKPPSLKEQALAILDDASDRLDAAHENIIRRALESLPE